MTSSRKKKRVDCRGYSAVLKDLETTRPCLYRYLKGADSNRAERLKHWKSGIRLKGLEDLIVHLPEVAAVYERNRKLRHIAFLINRVHGDFVTAVEATLSGYHLVTFDAMRDVMEIEFLLRDFFFHPEHIDEWLTATDQRRLAKFRPAVLRQRHAARFGKQPQDLSESYDYSGHSKFLHVSPYSNPFGNVGLNVGDIAFAADSGFWEMYEHGRRVLFAIHRLRRKLAKHLSSPLGPERGLKDFRNGWQTTQMWQTLFLAMVEVMNREEEDSNAGSSG